MHINLVTLFPEFFDSPLRCGLVARARAAGMLSFACVNPRDFALDRHRSVDDRPYGGGPGMVMLLEPLRRAVASLMPAQGGSGAGRVLLLTPRGKPLTQALAREWSTAPTLTLVCGRYEGFDARLVAVLRQTLLAEQNVAQAALAARVQQTPPLVEEVSVGDFVMGGGEAGALCLIEAVGRLMPQFMGHEASADEESFSSGLLEYPHYTRPETHADLAVPEVLLSGDHGRIAAWRREESLAVTLERRPELLETAELDAADLRCLRRLAGAEPDACAVAATGEGQGAALPAGCLARPRVQRQLLGRRLYVALLHHPVCDKFGRTVTVSLTNLDIHDIARCSRSNNLGGYFVVTPLEDQRRLAEELLGHWLEGSGSEANPDRALALDLVRVVPGLDEVLDAVGTLSGSRPLVVASSARLPRNDGRRAKGRRGRRETWGRRLVSHSSVRDWLRERPVLLLLGTGHGLAGEVLEAADAVLRPLRWLEPYNHFSVRTAAAVMLDRILGDIW